MLALCKFSLGPILLAQASRVRKTALRLPEPPGPREGRIGTQYEKDLRVLFLGDSSAAGVGVSHQREALAMQSVHRLSTRLQCTVSWQLVAKSGVNTREALELLAGSSVHSADVLVTALGTNDVTSQQSAGAFIANYEAITDEVVARTGARAFVITGVPPFRILPGAPQPLRWYLGKYAQGLDDRLGRWCSERPNTSFLSLQWAIKAEEMAIDRYHPGKVQYTRWSELVCEHVVRLLGAPPSATLSTTPVGTCSGSH